MPSGFFEHVPVSATSDLSYKPNQLCVWSFDAGGGNAVWFNISVVIGLFLSFFLWNFKKMMKMFFLPFWTSCIRDLKIDYFE